MRYEIPFLDNNGKRKIWLLVSLLRNFCYWYPVETFESNIKNKSDITLLNAFIVYPACCRSLFNFMFQKPLSKGKIFRTYVIEGFKYVRV